MGQKGVHGCFLCSSVRRYGPEGAAVSNARRKAETVGYWAQVGQVKPIGKPFLGFTPKVESSGGLSPLLGALYLTPHRRMDRLCKGKRLVHYVRYMKARAGRFNTARLQCRLRCLGVSIFEQNPPTKQL